jgi:uncharacterized membrane protein YoaK (UPF0700 family)
MDESPRLPAALLALTFSTGLVDAVSVLGLGQVFTANMTGNVVFLGFAAAGAGGFDVPRSGAAVVAFLAGAVLGGRIGAGAAIDVPGTRERALAMAAAVEGALLALAAWLALGYAPATLAPVGRLYGILGLCAVAMGLRNALVRRLAVADLTTTVLTLTLTGLGADSTLAGGASPRWARRIGAVLLMAAGAASGAALLQGDGRGALVRPLLGASALAFAVAVSLARAPRRMSPEAPPQAPQPVRERAITRR